MPRKETYSGPISAQAQQDLVSEGIENFELPKSLVMKIAKSALPENVKLQKETVLSLVKGSTVFINYLAAIAHDVAQSKQHKSISASDVLKALETIEFGDMVGKLQNELNVYREVSKNDKGKKGTSNGASSSSKKISTGGGGGGGGGASSISAPPKGKGKEKATSGNPLPPPFTSAPLGPVTNPRVAELSQGPMDVDEDESSISAAGGGAARTNSEGDVVEGEGEVDPEEEAVESDQDEKEAEELVDKEKLEEKELRRDIYSSNFESKHDSDFDSIEW